MNVLAIDIAKEAVEIMKKKGVKRVHCRDIFNMSHWSFDTMILLGHGIGMTGTIEGFRKFLAHARTIISPEGQILFDSLDVRCTTDEANLAYQENNRKNNIYIGEIRLHFEYKGETGQPWNWLQIDPETLEAETAAAGWSCEIIRREPTGDYLARLKQKEVTPANPAT